MKVKELIRLLTQCPPDADVIASKDEEGNDYHNVVQVDVADDNRVIIWPDSQYVDI